MTGKAPRTGEKSPERKAVAEQPVTASPALAPEIVLEPETSSAAEVAEVASPAVPAEDAVVDVKAEVTPVVATPVPAKPKKATKSAPKVAAKVAKTPKAVKAAPVVAPKTSNAAPKTADTKRKAVSKGNTIMDTTIEKTQAIFADFNARAKAAVEKNTQLVGEFNELAKGNVEALVESSKITAKGLEAIGQNAAEYSRKSFEQATATLKSLSTVKSPADFFKLQSEYVRSTFDSLVAETSKNTEALIKLAGDASQPVSNRVAVTIEKVKTAA